MTHLFLVRSDIRLNGPGIMVLKTALAFKCRGYIVTVFTGCICNDIKNKLSLADIKISILPFLVYERGLDFLNPLNIKAFYKAVLKNIEKGIPNQAEKRSERVIIHAFNYRSALTAWAAGKIYEVQSNKPFKPWSVACTAVGFGLESFLGIMPFKTVSVSKYQSMLIQDKCPFYTPLIIENNLIDRSEVQELIKERSKIRKRLLKRFNWTNDSVIACAVSAHLPFKGTLRLVDAVAKTDNLCLVVQGAGPLRGMFKKKIACLGIEKRVGIIEEGLDRLDVMAGSDIFLHLPRSETFCIALTEAASLGCLPVVSSRGAMPDLIKRLGHGICVDPDDIRAIQNLLQIICSDKESINLQFKKEISQRACTLFNIEKSLDALEQLWENSEKTFGHLFKNLFFFQTRQGRYNKFFSIAKLRSMYCFDYKLQQQESPFKKVKGPVLDKKIDFTKPHDPRITSWGFFIRKHSIDEVPQLWNLFSGDISLIGPRPDTYQQICELDPEARRIRLSCKQGVTGLSQVSGRSGLKPAQRLALDIYYAVNRSFFLNTYILIKTIIQACSGIVKSGRTGSGDVW